MFFFPKPSCSPSTFLWTWHMCFKIYIENVLPWLYHRQTFCQILRFLYSQVLSSCTCFLLMFPSLAFICLSGTRARVRQSRWMPDWSSFLTARLTGITRCARAGFYVPLCSWGRPELEMSKPLLKPDNLRWAVSFEDLACAVPLKKNANSLKCRAP